MKQHPINFFKNHNITPRDIQIEVINKVHENWDKYKYFLLNCPVGTGKTYIATAIADSIENAYILTNTLQLQNQYESSWSSLVNLKGRGNYQCNVNTNFKVDAAPCMASPELVSNCIKNKTCAYYNQKDKALESQSMITNPLYFLYSTHCGFGKDVDRHPWKKRSALIIDEAHATEDNLINFAESTLDPKKLYEDFGVECRDVEFTNDFVLNYELLLLIQKSLQARADYYKQKIEQEFTNNSIKTDLLKWARGFKDKESERIKKLNTKAYALDKALQPLNIFFATHNSMEELDTRWFIHTNIENNTITLSPLYGNFLFQEYMSKMADKFIFMSATTGTKESFCKEIGIKEDECLYIEVDTPFPPEKSPIIVFPYLNLSYKGMQETLPKIGPIIDQILDEHKDSRGLIHSVTYNLTNELVKRVSKKNKERLVYRDMYVTDKNFIKINNETMLKQHETLYNSVLVSPSMMEGVDLKDDLSTFQIILKFPWASLGDPRIKKKNEIDPDWYMNNMFLNVMQASGRSTRHENDHSTTYILDAQFSYHYNKWKHRLPKWFTDRIVT